MDELLKLAKRLADYVRMTIETGELKPDSPIGIAYRDFIKEWDKRHETCPLEDALGGEEASEQQEKCPIGKCLYCHYDLPHISHYIYDRGCR